MQHVTSPAQGQIDQERIITEHAHFESIHDKVGKMINQKFISTLWFHQHNWGSAFLRFVYFKIHIWHYRTPVLCSMSCSNAGHNEWLLSRSVSNQSSVVCARRFRVILPCSHEQGSGSIHKLCVLIWVDAGRNCSAACWFRDFRSFFQNFSILTGEFFSEFSNFWPTNEHAKKSIVLSINLYKHTRECIARCGMDRSWA